MEKGLMFGNALLTLLLRKPITNPPLHLLPLGPIILVVPTNFRETRVVIDSHAFLAGPTISFRDGFDAFNSCGISPYGFKKLQKLK